MSACKPPTIKYVDGIVNWTHVHGLVSKTQYITWKSCIKPIITRYELSATFTITNQQTSPTEHKLIVSDRTNMFSLANIQILRKFGEWHIMQLCKKNKQNKPKLL